MKMKTVIEYALLTLGITLFTWGGMVVLGQFGVTMENPVWLGIPWFIAYLCFVYRTKK